MQSITKVGVEEAVEVLRKAPELKLTFGIRAFRDIIVKASKDGDLAAMRRCVTSTVQLFISLQIHLLDSTLFWPG